MTQLIQELRVKQTTTLTPRLQQSVKLLQMSTLDFSREVADAIANNPFLEDEEGHDAEGSLTVEPATANNLPEISLESNHLEEVTSSEDSSSYDSVITAEYDSSTETSGEYSGDYPTSRNNN